MLHLLATAVALQPATPPAQCNGTSTYCPAGVSCCASQYSPTKQGCQFSPSSYTLVTDHCGAVPYEDCDWCRKHPCSYHYNGDGETPQAAYIAGTIRTMLAE